MKKNSFTTKEARKLGVSPRMLVYFYREGHLERIGRGVYRSSSYEGGKEWQWQDLAWVASSIPESVICLISALCYYEMTDQFSRENWIAIPSTNRPPPRKNTRIVRMRNMKTGIKKINLCGYNVRIFDRERTVIDSFRFLEKETAIKALKHYLRATEEHQPDIRKLTRYARKLRVKIEPYITTFLI